MYRGTPSILISVLAAKINRHTGEVKNHRGIIFFFMMLRKAFSTFLVPHFGATAGSEPAITVICIWRLLSCGRRRENAYKFAGGEII
jgi:hypothetical protein